MKILTTYNKFIYETKFKNEVNERRIIAEKTQQELRESSESLMKLLDEYEALIFSSDNDTIEPQQNKAIQVESI